MPSTSTFGEDWREPPRVRRAMLVVDMVESVQLMHANEVDVIARWRSFLRKVKSDILPPSQGRLVKSLGDGMLIEFERVSCAVTAALQIQKDVAPLNAGRPDDQHLLLRAGIHVCDVVVDEDDVFGSGVNLTARLATLAAPGEIVISAEAQQQMLVGIDADLEDMGECWVKNLPMPVRAFRLRPPGQIFTRRAARARAKALRPKVAVVPITPRDPTRPAGVTEAVLTDALVDALARQSHWLVISRLSTAALSGHSLAIDSVASIVDARYVIVGKTAESAGRIRLNIEIYESGVDEVVWSGMRESSIEELLLDRGLVSRAVEDIATRLLSRQLEVAHESALPNMPGYSLLLHAISMLHSLSRDNLGRSREALEHLTYRHPNAPEAKAWLAKWHFLQVAQAASADRGRDIACARAQLAAALELDPTHALSLAIDGHLSSFLDGDTRTSLERLRTAVDHGANEPLAWLFLSHALTNSGQVDDAVDAIEHAQGLSPIDPLGYYYELFAASAYSAAGRHDDALELTRRSLARNALHLSTWVQLIVDLVLIGRLDEAREGARHYLSMRPSASVQRFYERHSARETPLARRDADALLEAGLPH